VKSRSGVPRGSSWEMAPRERFSRGRPSPASARVVYYDESGRVIDPVTEPVLHAAAVDLESNRVLMVTEERKRAAAEEQGR
jgi:hypothetical protein